MAKILLALTVLTLLLVGYVFVRGVSSSIRFSAKIMTWIVILVIVIGASWINQQQNENRPKKPDFLESRQEDSTWR